MELSQNAEAPKRVSSRTAAKKVDYVELANGKNDGYFDEFEEDDKPARSRQRSQKRNRKHSGDSYDGDDDYYHSSNRKRGSKSKGYSSKSARKCASPDNQLSLLLKWRCESNVQVQKTSKATNTKVVMSQNILKSDLSKFGKDLQAIFINVLWQTSSRLNQNGKSINDLKHLKIPQEAMKGGIIFISCEKEVLGQLVDTMEDLGFTYIENFQVIFLSSEKCLSYLSDKETGSSASLGGESTASQSNLKEGSEQTFETNLASSNSSLKSTKKNQKKSKVSAVEDQLQLEESRNLKLSKIPEKSESQIMEDKDKIIDSIPVLKQAKINDLFLNNDYPVFKKSKHTILMFRKFGEKGTVLELRHQRTSDVVFEVANEFDPSNLDQQLKGYVYQMIETLLPKAQFDSSQGKNSFKLMELFADKDHPRSGWISVCEK